MFPAHNLSTLSKPRSQRRKLRSRHRCLIQSIKKNRLLPTTSFTVDHFLEILTTLKHCRACLLSYTTKELELACQQIAKQHMATRTDTDYCPLTCVFCQGLIYEPVTLYCGHTFCEQCIGDERMSSSMDCPRCPRDNTAQSESAVVHARLRSYGKNRLLKQLLERSQTLRTKCENTRLRNQGQKEHANGNYQQAIEIYTGIIEQCRTDHLAFYNRAKAYSALKQHEQGLSDATTVIKLKPQWPKGYLCQSEILFDMKRSAAALMSSLKALVIDPEDQEGKQIMARHLHAVLHNEDDKKSDESMETELEQCNQVPSSTEENTIAMTSVPDDTPLTLCQSKDAGNSCFCLQLDYKEWHVRDFECSICVSLLWLPVTTPCGHVFCRECFIRSVDNTQALCPICKNSVDEFFAILIRSHVNQTEVISKMIETYFPNELKERRQLFEQDNIRGVSIPQSIINDTNQSESASFEIPIFVCVLALPECVCPLHVFEPRYRLMMRRAVETESRSFGMCTYDEQTDTFADYGTLLFIRGLMYTRDGRSIVDTIGQRRFRVLERGMRDGYSTARVELIRDHPIEQHEFKDLFQLNRDTYNRVRDWFDQLDPYTKSIVSRQLPEYPSCDDLQQESNDGPAWTWIILNLLPIEQILQYTALASQSLRVRLQIINNAIDFFLRHQQSTFSTSNDQ